MLPCGNELDEVGHAQAQPGQRDCADDDAGAARGDGDADHVASAVVAAVQHVLEPDSELATEVALLAEQRDQRSLRNHQHHLRRHAPERRQSGRQFLDHQAPDQHAHRDQEVQTGLHRRPGGRQHRILDVDLGRQIGLRRGHPDAVDVQGAEQHAENHRRGRAEQRLRAQRDVVDDAEHHRTAAPAPSPHDISRLFIVRSRSRAVGSMPSFSASRCTM